jgi:hypothetical protein
MSFPRATGGEEGGVDLPGELNLRIRRIDISLRSTRSRRGRDLHIALMVESAPFERFTSPTHGDRNPVPGASVLAPRETRRAPAVERLCRKIDARERTATKFNAEGAGSDNASCNAKPSFGMETFSMNGQMAAAR